MMNPVRGESTFEALGKSWRFKLGNEAMCEIETSYGKSIGAVLSMFDDADAKVSVLLRDVLVAGLRRFQPDVTAAVASDIIDDLGMAGAVTMLLGSARQAFPAAREQPLPNGASQLQ